MSANFVIDEDIANADSLEYISKSRLKEWIVCQWRFYKKYVEGKREPENEAMKRGSDIHETFELFYENAESYFEQNSCLPDDLATLLPDNDLWEDYREPYIKNFLDRERERLEYLQSQASDDNLTIEEVGELWLPIAIEQEKWDTDKTPDWMGYADVILHARSVPSIEQTDGVLIVDFKTGNTPNEEYRDKGIFLEGEFYALLFGDDYNIAGVAGYYPKDDDFLISPLDESRREIIHTAVEEMTAAETPEDYTYTEQPLCAWGDSEDERCPYYNNECESTWAKPIDNKDEFIDYCNQGFASSHIALEMETSVDAVKYWARKLGREHQLMDV